MGQRHQGGINYRQDIDGLRAVAVLSVFAYHLNPALLPSGGLGVDIFFVISGYLIGGIILRESDAQNFSFLRFYERRLRRIVPALIVCIIGVLIASCVTLMPSDFEATGVSGVAALLSASNLYFWQTVDYFNEAAADMPLLHTWSLGVEEQFYILAPILLALLSKYARPALMPTLLIALVASLTLNVAQVTHAPVDAFYLPQGRAWELLAGVVLNRLQGSMMSVRGLRELVAGLGAMLIAGSLLLLDPASGWPGLAAVPPVLGTALVILAGQHGKSTTARILSCKPMTFIGLISYSLYLWHWPAIVFAREIGLVDQLSNLGRMLVLLFAILAAWLSWRFVEQPFRRPADMPASRLFRITGAGAALVLCLCAGIIIGKGLPSRFDPETVRIASYAGGSDANPARHCILTERDALEDFPADCLAPPREKRRVLLLGDSHANMFRPALDKLADTSVMEATYAACAPDDALAPSAATTPCGRLFRKALATARHDRPDLVIVSWQVKRMKPERVRALGQQLKGLGAPILLIGPTPEYSVRVPKLMAAARIRGNPDLPAGYMSRFLWKSDAQLGQIAPEFATYLSPRKAMCSGWSCALTAGGNPAYYDRQHFNAQGARFVFATMIATQLSSAERQRLGLADLQP